MHVQFYSGEASLGEAEFSALPPVGSTVYLRLAAGYPQMSDGSAAITEVHLKVEAITCFIAFNSSRVEEWMTTTWRAGTDAYVVLEVSALDEETQVYIDRRVKAQESDE